MPFEKLLFTCLLPGIHRFKENKTVVEITPQHGETILFFCIDSHSKGHDYCGNCRLRNFLWGKEEGQPICDLLVFYAKENRRVICFVELKDNKSDLDHGTEQVINTCNALKRKLESPNNNMFQAFLIGHHGSAPSMHHNEQKKLAKEFKSYIYDAKAEQFAKFLRGEDSSSLSKKERKKKKKNKYK
jgi:hypothetical protein